MGTSASTSRLQHLEATTTQNIEFKEATKAVTVGAKAVTATATGTVEVAVAVATVVAGVAVGIIWRTNEKQRIIPKENCLICLEDVDSRKILQIGLCRHRFCASCIQKHLQLKLRDGELPLCPHFKCGSLLDMKCCRKLLTRKTYAIMDHLVKESTIPAKVYCANPKCSYVMSIPEALASKPRTDRRLRCAKCSSLFCFYCKVLWHPNMPCGAYKKPAADDAKFMEFARKKKWRQCPRCFHMVERARGCNKITCRCGQRFCYRCGLEWMSKNCSCSYYV